MCTQARSPSASSRTESASSKSFAVSGSIVNAGRSRRSVRPSIDGLRRVVRLEAFPQSSLDHQPLEDRLDVVHAAEHAFEPRPAPSR